MVFINGSWQEGRGVSLESISPIDESIIWRGNEADAEQVRQAFLAAANAQSTWAAKTVDERFEYIETFAKIIDSEKEHLGEISCREVGKPLKESIGEVAAVVGKCGLTREAHDLRKRGEEHDLGTRIGRVEHRPLGVVSVFGPFNFPMHIANGQIVPALLAGNTVVFKPSELTPWSAEAMVKIWERAGLPPGVMNLVQGGINPGQEILKQPELRGLFFTGSRATGIHLRKALADRLEVLLALELGGNNPLVVHEGDLIEQAVELTIQSAFISAGQRCTCVRRLIVTEPTTIFLEQLAVKTKQLKIGNPLTDAEALMGPLIHRTAADRVLSEQERLIKSGGKPMVLSEAHPLGPAYVTPGIIDVTDCQNRSDDELFGPLLQVVRVANLDEAIEEANGTEFGLSAGLICRREDEFDEFRSRVNAGLLNLNLPTTGASGRLPFGGLGHSGNYRPAGFYAIDFCSQPVAQLTPLTDGKDQ